MGVELELALMFGGLVAVIVAVSSFQRFKTYRVDTLGRPYENTVLLALRAGAVLGATVTVASWLLLLLVL